MKTINLIIAFIVSLTISAQRAVKVAYVSSTPVEADNSRPMQASVQSRLQTLLGTGFDVHTFSCASSSSHDKSNASMYAAAKDYQPDIVILQSCPGNTESQGTPSTMNYRKQLEKTAKSFAKSSRLLLAYPCSSKATETEAKTVIDELAAKNHWTTIDLNASTKEIIQSLLADSNRTQVTLTTDFGDIVVELFNETPLHRDNFIRQVKNKSFDGVLWHRVINSFIIQTGDRLSKHAKPGEMLGDGDETPADWVPAEFRAPLFYHQRGMLNAAREGDETNPEKKSSSTQFTIVTGQTFDDASLDRTQLRIDEWTNHTFKLTPEMRETYKTIGGAPHLDGSYTVFGRVVSGMETVEKIEKLPTDQNDRPIHDCHIIKAKVTKKMK